MFEQLLNNFRKHISLSDQEVELLITHVEFRKVKKKQWLVTPGEPCRSEHYINKGCFRAYCIDEQGHEHVTKISTEDWWITDIQSFLSGDPAQLYVEALEDGEVIVFRKHMLEELYKRIPQLNKYFRLLYQLALVNNQRRIFQTISNTAEEHYLRFLEQHPELEQRVPQYMIASYLGITPEFLSKIRKKRMQKT
jgi:CRP-like cAMP-binding protein